MHVNKHKDHFHPIIENMIIVAILFVVAHTIIEDLSQIYNWPHQTVLNLSIAGLFFDFLFTVEFIGRSIVSYKHGSLGQYIKYHRGWIDAISSVPLLLFVSGPTVILYLLGHTEAGIGVGFLSILKSAKAIRVTRILRLIRIIKIFGKIQNTDSTMTNRHVGIISTISVVTLVVVLVITQFLPFARIGDHNDYLENRQKEVEAFLRFDLDSEDHELLKQYIENSPANQDIISIKTTGGFVIYEHPDKNDLMWKAFNAGVPFQLGRDYKVILSYHLADAEHAKSNMIIFLSILGLILSFMFIYSKAFAQQVADPIFVMDKALREWEYNLAVKDNDHYHDDEIFQLARAFNVKWLPVKNQIRAFRKKNESESEKTILKMEDLF